MRGEGGGKKEAEARGKKATNCGRCSEGLSNLVGDSKRHVRCFKVRGKRKVVQVVGLREEI